jgi:hypothetical protein
VEAFPASRKKAHTPHRAPNILSLTLNVKRMGVTEPPLSIEAGPRAPHVHRAAERWRGRPTSILAPSPRTGPGPTLPGSASRHGHIRTRGSMPLWGVSVIHRRIRRESAPDDRGHTQVATTRARASKVLLLQARRSGFRRVGSVPLASFRRPYSAGIYARLPWVGLSCDTSRSASGTLYPSLHETGGRVAHRGRIGTAERPRPRRSHLRAAPFDGSRSHRLDSKDALPGGRPRPGHDRARARR